MEGLKLSKKEKKAMRGDLAQLEKQRARDKRKKMKISDFESLALIGRGAFGEVRSPEHRTQNTGM